MQRRIRQALTIVIVCCGASVIALLNPVSLFAQQSVRGVFGINPDPAVIQPGGQASATIDSEDGGQRSCLNGTVPRSPSGGFRLSFASPVSPQIRPRGSTTWSTTGFVDVAPNVPPGNYPIPVWLQAYNNGACTGAKLGPTYEYWDLSVVIPPSPGPSPSPTPLAGSGPIPSGSPPVGASISPTPTLTSATPTGAPSDIPLPSEGSSVEAGSFERDVSASRSIQNPGQAPRKRYSLALAVDDSSIFEPTAGKLTFAALMALVLTLVIAFPSELFNTTWQENSAEIRGWLSLTKKDGKWHRVTRRLSRTWLGFGLLTLIIAALYGLLSPDFGLDLPSLGLFLAITAALIVVIASNELTAALYTKRYTGRVYLRVFPGTLFVAIMCVAISRLSGFQPGYLYGLVAGAAVRGGLGKDVQGRSAAVASLGLLVVSVAAWFAWLPVRQIAAMPDPSQGVLVLEAFLVATFVAGLEGLLFGLLPITFLDGHKLASWNRAFWAALFFLAAFSFVHILLDPDASYVSFSPGIPSAVVFGLFFGFAIFSVAFWAYFRFRRPRAA